MLVLKCLSRTCYIWIVKYLCKCCVDLMWVISLQFFNASRNITWDKARPVQLLNRDCTSCHITVTMLGMAVEM